MTIVYTTIFGGCDSLKKAPSGASRCVCFVDDPSLYAGHTRGWELIPHTAVNPRREAWHLRCVSHELFPEARKTIWIDASFTLLDLNKLLMDSSGHPIAAMRHHARQDCYHEGLRIIENGQASAADVNRQLHAYRSAGFNPQSMSITCVLVREHTPDVTAFNETWDHEIRTHRGDNTQLSLDYSAWKNGLTIHHLQGEYRNNPYAHHNHKEHKLLRRPYDTDQMGRKWKGAPV